MYYLRANTNLGGGLRRYFLGSTWLFSTRYGRCLYGHAFGCAGVGGGTNSPPLAVSLLYDVLGEQKHFYARSDTTWLRYGRSPHHITPVFLLSCSFGRGALQFLAILVGVML